MAEDRVWADVLKYDIPDELIGSIQFQQREADIIQYWYEAYDVGEFSSVWLLKFFERRLFVAAVSATGRGGGVPA